MLTEEKTRNPARFSKPAYSNPKNGRFFITNGHAVREPDIQATSQRRATANGSFVRTAVARDTQLNVSDEAIATDASHYANGTFELPTLESLHA